MRTKPAIAIAMASCVLIAGFILSCNARLQLDAELSIGEAPLPIEVLEYAELRLVTPMVTTLDDGSRRAAVAFPLKHTAVTARVGGMMAEYEIEQEFENPFDVPIEAVYTFPLGHTGAVNGYQMIIGDRTITGEIQRREEARAMYDEAKTAGHTAALVEQQKPNIFTQHIANIAPYETVRVKLSYVDLLKHRDGAYELVVPLVVGPRYLPADRVGASPVGSHHAGESGRANVTSIPYIDETRASSSVSFTAEIDAGVPIQLVKSVSHQLAVEAVSPTRSRVTLAQAGEIPNRDLRVKYYTAGPTTTAGVLAHRSGNDGYFVLSIQPKGTYVPADITGREVIVVIDTSGSMDGAPLLQAKRVARGILESLTERDSFNILGFANSVEAMSSRLTSGDARGKAAGMSHLAKMTTRGGTEMELGVIEMLTRKPGEHRVRVIYFLTDGFVGNDDVVLGAAHSLLGSNRIFTVGIGEAPNRALLDSLADIGRGFSTYVGLNDHVPTVTDTLLRGSTRPYLTDVSIDWGSLDVAQQDPGILPDVYAGQPLVVSGRYARPGHGTIRILGRTAGQPVVIPVEVELPAQANLPPIASLWARRRIEQLSRPNELDPTVVEASITRLGLEFHLMTSYTSFIAVDRSRVVAPGGNTPTVEQPAIVPAGTNPATTVGRGEPFKPLGHWRDNAQHQKSRSYNGGGGGGGGGSFFGSGGPEPWPHTPVLVIALVLLGMSWRLARRVA
jgi:Ca-activated chloride channel family protein